MITIGLTLLLVSAIPSYSYGNSSFSSSETMVLQHSFSVITYGMSVLTPQQELYINCTTNQTLSIYILNVQWHDFMTNLNITVFWNSSELTQSVLQTYLDTHQVMILHQTTSSTGIITYTPTTIVNATLLFLNTADSNATLSYTIKTNTIYAPTTRLQQLALVTLPLGLLFAAPGIFNFYKNRKMRKKLSNGGPDRI